MSGGNGGEETWWGVGRSVYLLLHFRENLYKEPVLSRVLGSAVIMFEGSVYVFIAGDTGRVASINRRCGKSLSLGSPVLWQKSLFKYPSRLATS